MTDDSGSEHSLFSGEPADTRERIMRATFEALQKHGFAGLSIQRIADEADLSKSSFYHFFDDKDDLLLAFMDTMLQESGMPFAVDEDLDPLDALWKRIDFALYGIGEGPVPIPEDSELSPGSGRPYVEFRSQGTYNDEYRERFTAIDASMTQGMATVIEAGIEDGTFREVDPEQSAEFLLTVMLGGLFRRATADSIDVDAVRDELEAVIEARLLAEN